MVLLRLHDGESRNAISAPKKNIMFSEYDFSLNKFEKQEMEAMTLILQCIGVGAEGWMEVFQSLQSK